MYVLDVENTLSLQQLCFFELQINLEIYLFTLAHHLVIQESASFVDVCHTPCICIDIECFYELNIKHDRFCRLVMHEQFRVKNE